ncbi:MAG: hypothetical protein HWD83_06520, partial [Gammaproteobacteria bacterium]|nr:hypothetical protein [Gammaproteobacteria bacterium]
MASAARRWLIGGLVGLVFLVFVLMMLTPVVARWYINSEVPQLIGIDVSVDNVDVHWFDTAVTVEKLRIARRGEAALLEGASVEIDIDVLELLNNRVIVEYIELDGTDIDITRADGSHNLA